MTSNNPIFLQYRYFIIFMIICCLSACTKLPVKQPVEKEAPEPVKEKIEKDHPKVSILETLTTEAQKFFFQENYQDALLIYNQALSQASETQQPKVISAIEIVLAKTPTKT
ncbi:MAG: hypothetical protein H8D87_12510, partial [Deltaproteobacteria bacterium]|nr:hypothetical protein [Candidatus Desulfobacula maris]